MERFGTLVREKNIELFLRVAELPTLRDAARRSGLAYRHAKRLAEKWVSAGWIMKRPSLHGIRYFYTVEGASVASGMFELKRVMR